MWDFRAWFEADREKHDATWANNVIRFIRWNMRPLVNIHEAETGMKYLLGKQDMTFIQNLFQNPARLNLANANYSPKELVGKPVITRNKSEDKEAKKFIEAAMADVNFRPLPIMEKIRNILISEIKKMGIQVDFRAQDPTSTEDRKRDRSLVENHHEIQNFLSYIYTSIGQKPYSISDNEARFGEKAGNGNIDQFHSMGLNAADPTDVEYFFKNFHKLDQEIAALGPVEYFMSYNQILDKFENWVNDVLAKKAIAGRAYVSDVTGAIMGEYAAPETAYIYGGGRRKDYNDANAKVIEQRVTVKQLIDMLGNSFDIEKEWNNLLMAISFTGGIEFTDIKPSYRGWNNGFGDPLKEVGGAVYGYNDFLSFRVTLGYVEWTSQNLEDKGVGVISKDEAFFENNQPSNGERYQENARYETPTYKAYYLAVSAVDQVLFDFGLQTYQNIEGYSDFNNNFTIITWKEIGDPLSIICAPYLDLAMECWYKFRYEVRRSKPRGMDFNYDSILDMAEDIFADTTLSKGDKITKMVEWMDSSANTMYKWPVVDGKMIAMNSTQVNIERPNGLSPQAKEWFSICIDTLHEMMDAVGISPLREGDPGNPRDSMSNQFKALEYSEASTYYIPDMITYMVQQMAVKTTFYVQDIVSYKKYNTVAYKFLLDAVGQDTLDKIESLGRTALHRWGIFVESLNQAPMRAKLEAVLLEAVKNKTITTSEYLLLSDIKSPKKAFEIFAYMEQRNKRMAEKSAQQAQQAQQQAEISLERERQRTAMINGDYMLKGKKMDADAAIQSHLITQQGGIAKKAMDNAADAQNIERQAEIDLKAQQQNLNNTGKTTPSIPPPSTGVPALAAMPDQQTSQLDNLRQQAQPSNTMGA